MMTDPQPPKGEDADAMGEASDTESGAGYGNHAVEDEDVDAGDE